MQKRILLSTFFAGLVITSMIAEADSSMQVQKRQSNLANQKIYEQTKKDRDFDNILPLSNFQNQPVLKTNIEVSTSPGEIVGITWWERQHGTCMGRQISIRSDVGLSLAWTNFLQPWGGPCYVYYNYRYPEGGWIVPEEGVRVNNEEGVAAYTNLALLSDGRTVVGYSQFDLPPYHSVLAVETSAGSGLFHYYDIPDVIEGGLYRCEWPRLAVDSLDYIHAMMTEDDQGAAGIEWFGYIRAHFDENDSLWVDGPGLTPKIIIPDVFYEEPETCAFVDSNWFSSILPTCSPVSNKVAIVYTKLREFGTGWKTDCDLFYKESTNGGQDWIDSGEFSSSTNITNYQITDLERAYKDISAAYDYDDVLHILWNAGFFDEMHSAYNRCRTNLYHWNQAASEKHLIAHAYWDRPFCGFDAENICKMSIGVNPRNNYLYAIWSQFNLGDVSEGEWTNGEIYGSASTNGGLNWDFPRNLTNSPTPGCTPGNCDSDAWPSLAEIVNDTLHIFYINDKDAGSSRWDEGTRTENPVMYLSILAWEPDVQMEMVIFPESLHIHRPDASQIRDASFNIINSGNTYLTYEMTADSSWLWIDPYANILLPAETTVVDLHVDSVDLGDTAQAQITIECNDPENPVKIIPVFVYTILIRGDANCDGNIDIADVIYLINYLFVEGPPPLSFVQGDANADENIDIADVVYLINYLFIGGPPPPQ